MTAPALPTPQSFTIKQGDTGPPIQAVLQDAEGTVQDLTGATVRFHLLDVSGTVIIDASASVLDDAGGKVSYAWQAGDTDSAGSFKGEFEVTLPSGEIRTFPNWSNIRVKIVAELA